MEQKKSPEANLERYRLTWFLLGVIFILSTCYVCLKLTSDKQMIEAMLDSELEETDLDLSDLKLEKEEERIAVLVRKKEQPSTMTVVEELSEKSVPLEFYTPPLEDADMKPDEAVEEQLKAINENKEEEQLIIAEELPEFPGGLAEFARWVTKHMKYPEANKKSKKTGRVVAQFIVKEDGTVSELKLIKHCDQASDREVLRVMRMMPVWKPATSAGKPVPCMVCVPIEFAI